MHKNVLSMDLGGKVAVVTGAGGNNSRATTDDEYFLLEHLDSEGITFFDLDKGV